MSRKRFVMVSRGVYRVPDTWVFHVTRGWVKYALPEQEEAAKNGTI